MSICARGDSVVLIRNGKIHVRRGRLEFAKGTKGSKTVRLGPGKVHDIERLLGKSKNRGLSMEVLGNAIVFHDIRVTDMPCPPIPGLPDDVWLLLGSTKCLSELGAWKTEYCEL